MQDDYLRTWADQSNIEPSAMEMERITNSSTLKKIKALLGCNEGTDLYTCVNTAYSENVAGGGKNQTNEMILKQHTDRKYHAILHVGPHKTGTTTLQALMYDSLGKELVRDGYLMPPDIPGRFPGRKSMANLAFRLQESADIILTNDETYKAFERYLSQNTSTGILISSEEFDRAAVNISALKSALEPKYHVRVVVVYRRFFEWVASYYAELYKWSKTKYDFPSFVEWLRRQEMQSPNYKHELQASNVVARYQTYFEDVQILNYHDKKSLEESFFCDALRNKKGQACRKVKASKSTQMNQRRSNLDSTRLLIAAKKEGLIRSDPTKPRITQVQEFLDKQYSASLPLDCLEDDIVNAFWNVSLQEEKEAVSSWFKRPGGEADLLASFHRFQSSGELCCLNVTALLTNYTVRNFLTQLS
jgi:hypothetical protein